MILFRRYTLVFSLSVTLAVPVSVAASEANEIRDYHYAYDLRLRGFKLGEIRYSGREDGVSYSAAAIAYPTGVADMVVDLLIRGKVRGWIGEERLLPFRYQGIRERDGRSSTRTIHYEGGAFRSLEADPPITLDSGLSDELLASSIDPLTMLFIALQPTGAANLCDARHRLFDGKRMSLIEVEPAELSGGQAECDGSYTRLFGYSASEMEDNPALHFKVIFTETTAGSGMFQLQRFEVTTDSLQLSMSRQS